MFLLQDCTTHAQMMSGLQELVSVDNFLPGGHEHRIRVVTFRVLVLGLALLHSVAVGVHCGGKDRLARGGGLRAKSPTTCLTNFFGGCKATGGVTDDVGGAGRKKRRQEERGG